MNPQPSPPAKPALPFADWSARLNADPSLAPGLRESYRLTLSRFLAFCAQRQAHPAVPLAREHLELARLEQAPSPARLQEWKEALNWYFRQRRQANAPTLPGVPPLARTDLGQTPWEAALIAGLRERHLAWRTEQTYRGWLWRFARFLGERPVTEAGAGEVKAFLSHLAVTERASVSAQKQALAGVERGRLRVESQAASKDLRRPLNIRLCFSAAV